MKILRVDVGMHEPSYFRWDDIEKKFRPQTIQELEKAIITLHQEHKFDLIEIDGIHIAGTWVVERLRFQGLNVQIAEIKNDNSKRKDGN